MELAQNLSDPGQITMRAAGAPDNADAYAFKVERASGKVEYLRGLVAGPNNPGGRNEGFILNTNTPRIWRPPDKPDMIRPASLGALYWIETKDPEHGRTVQHRGCRAPP